MSVVLDRQWRMLDRRTSRIWYMANMYILTLVMRHLHIEMYLLCARHICVLHPEGEFSTSMADVGSPNLSNLVSVHLRKLSVVDMIAMWALSFRSDIYVVIRSAHDIILIIRGIHEIPHDERRIKGINSMACVYETYMYHRPSHVNTWI